jgi:sugar phosphate isomerase/epimerase
MPAPLPDLSRLAIHTMTTKPWDIETAIAKYASAGVPALTVWRQWLAGRDPAAVGRAIADHGLRVSALCRGGFFAAATERERIAAIDDTKRAIDEAAALGAPHMVLVCGAAPALRLSENRRHITAGIAACLGHAAAARVQLAIEPLHPMYAGDRCAVNTLAQANDIVDQLGEDRAGIALDVYHVWWDPDLPRQIARAGRRILGFHVCDWLCPTSDFLCDRGLMGEGCIDIPEIRGLVEAAGFTGWIEVEIFSNRWWAAGQDAFLRAILEAFTSHV